MNADGTLTVTDLRSGSPDGTDTLKSIEYLQFADQTVAAPAPPPNNAPVASNDTYFVDKRGTLTVNAANGMLANDIDADSQSLTAALVSSTAKGSLSLNADGSFTYKAARRFTGDVTFTYNDSDGKDHSNNATVTIHVGTSASGTATNAGSHGQDKVDLSNDQIPTEAHDGAIPNNTVIYSQDQHNAVLSSQSGFNVAQLLQLVGPTLTAEVAGSNQIDSILGSLHVAELAHRHRGNSARSSGHRPHGHS